MSPHTLYNSKLLCGVDPGTLLKLLLRHVGGEVAVKSGPSCAMDSEHGLRVVMVTRWLKLGRLKL